MTQIYDEVFNTLKSLAKKQSTRVYLDGVLENLAEKETDGSKVTNWDLFKITFLRLDFLFLLIKNPLNIITLIK